MNAINTYDPCFINGCTVAIGAVHRSYGVRHIYSGSITFNQPYRDGTFIPCIFYDLFCIIYINFLIISILVLPMRNNNIEIFLSIIIRLDRVIRTFDFPKEI